ncbi:MAG TPA: ATP-binding protein, partial [Kofleriaceae bacterium]
LDLTIADTYDECWDFFVIVSGNNVELPRLFGLPAAEVKLTKIPGGGRMEITVPTWRVPILQRLWRLVTRPFTASTAGRELKEAHETLVERFSQLEDAQTKLDRQATQLRTAHTLNELAQRDLDLRRTLDTLTAALVGEAGFNSASIVLADGSGRSNHGEETGPTFARALAARSGQVLGQLELRSTAASNAAERDDLLALITPTIAIAIENAVYRAGLERLVEQRTVELEAAVNQLREAQGARERFFGNISHEIRTPLSLIMLSVADIERRAGRVLDARSSQNLASVSEAARKLVRLVDELLLLAAGQEGKFKLHREPTDLAALVDQLVAAWRPATEVAGLELVAITAASLTANVDPVAFERIASNLVSNAVKYTPRGGRIEIELAAADEIIFAVRDTGPGIDSALAARLFGRFERGSHELVKGSGIGLSLVKQLVEAHGGTIQVRARTPQGTEVHVALPLPASQTAAPIRELALAAPSVDNVIENGQRFVPTGSSLGTIVLAEDDPQLARATAELLSSRYTVIIGTDGEAALELVTQYQPQLLITDIEMPRKNGIELAKAFRDAVGDKLAPIIILSAVIDLGTRVAGLEAGAIDYVTKPFDARELVARVDAQFRMRELAIRLQQAEQLSTLGILTSGLAHELRNPANGIVNAIAPLVDLLPPELVGPDTGPGQLLEVMAGCADQIRFLSKQLLGFRSGMQLEVSLVDVTDLVRRSIGVSKAGILGVELRTQLGGSREIRCSAPLLVQALTNLIENAGHAAGRGGWVEVSTWTETDRITVEVADSGPGVPIALRERVFQPFFTT